MYGLAPKQERVTKKGKRLIPGIESDWYIYKPSGTEDHYFTKKMFAMMAEMPSHVYKIKTRRGVF